MEEIICLRKYIKEVQDQILCGKKELCRINVRMDEVYDSSKAQKYCVNELKKDATITQLDQDLRDAKRRLKIVKCEIVQANEEIYSLERATKLLSEERKEMLEKIEIGSKKYEKLRGEISKLKTTTCDHQRRIQISRDNLIHLTDVVMRIKCTEDECFLKNQSMKHSLEILAKLEGHIEDEFHRFIKMKETVAMKLNNMRLFRDNGLHDLYIFKIYLESQSERTKSQLRACEARESNMARDCDTLRGKSCVLNQSIHNLKVKMFGLQECLKTIDHRKNHLEKMMPEVKCLVRELSTKVMDKTSILKYIMKELDIHNNYIKTLCEEMKTLSSTYDMEKRQSVLQLDGLRTEIEMDKKRIDDHVAIKHSLIYKVSELCKTKKALLNNIRDAEGNVRLKYREAQFHINFRAAKLGAVTHLKNVLLVLNLEYKKYMSDAEKYRKLEDEKRDTFHYIKSVLSILRNEINDRVASKATQQWKKKNMSRILSTMNESMNANISQLTLTSTLKEEELIFKRVTHSQLAGRLKELGKSRHLLEALNKDLTGTKDELYSQASKLGKENQDVENKALSIRLSAQGVMRNAKQMEEQLQVEMKESRKYLDKLAGQNNQIKELISVERKLNERLAEEINKLPEKMSLAHNLVKEKRAVTNMKSRLICKQNALQQTQVTLKRYQAMAV